MLVLLIIVYNVGDQTEDYFIITVTLGHVGSNVKMSWSFKAFFFFLHFELAVAFQE